MEAAVPRPNRGRHRAAIASDDAVHTLATLPMAMAKITVTTAMMMSVPMLSASIHLLYMSTFYLIALLCSPQAGSKEPKRAP
jgi:hypothetical protein